MKGYLTHLILRQQGETPAIRPRLPSRFERAAEIEQPALPQFFTVGRPTAQIPTVFPANARLAPREPGGSRAAKAGTMTTPDTPMTPGQRGPVGNDSDANVAHLPPAWMPSPTSGAVHAGAPHEPEMASSTEHEHSASQATVAVPEMSQLPQARVAEPSVTRLSASKVRPSQSLTPPPQQTLHAVLPADAPARRSQAMAAAERPSIRVSIGRIDVRADLGRAAPAKPKSSAQMPQPQPLADYLKGRGAA